MVNGSNKQLVRFGVFELDLEAGELRKQGLRLHLQPKPLQMLALLLERPGEIVTRDELRRRLWDGDIFVDFESGLNTVANRLRLKLGDSADTPRYIETLSRTGYRFIAPVQRIDWTLPSPLPEPVKPAAPISSMRSRKRWYLAAACLAVVFLAYLAMRPSSPHRVAFRQLTFRRGQVLAARFAPDGQTVLYAAQWDREPRRLFLTNVSSPESRSLGFQDMTLAAVSKGGELALISSGGTMNIAGGKLFRVQMNSSDPSFVDQSVMSAEWTRDAGKLALVRALNGQNELEYPAGNVVYRTSGSIGNLRISPASDSIAFIEHPVRHDDGGRVRMISAGANKILGGDWDSISGLAWRPSGGEIWFTASRKEGPRSVWAVSPGGRLRRVAEAPGVLTLRDIAPDGKTLLSRDIRRLEISGKLAGDVAERDLSWLDWSRIQEISSDGSLILFDESGEAAGGHPQVYIRRAGGAVLRLGQGFAAALSPDSRFALLISEDHRVLSLIRVAGGKAANLPESGLSYQWAKYLPDGKRLIALAHESQGGLRLYVQTLETGKTSPISSAIMVRNAAVSPDGAQIAVLTPANRLMIYPTAGGDPRELPSTSPMAPLRWSADGKWIFAQTLRSYTDLPARILRVQTQTGKTQPWRDITPADPMGVNSVTGVSIAADEHSYAYSYRRVLSELYLVEGWL